MSVRDKLLGVKITEEEMATLRAAAAPRTLSGWAREILFSAAVASPSAAAAGCATQGATAQDPEPAHSFLESDHVSQTENMVIVTWADEWAAMERMEPSEAMAHFTALQDGRKLPDGFRSWPKSRKVEWLNREWAL